MHAVASERNGMRRYRFTAYNASFSVTRDLRFSHHGSTLEHGARCSCTVPRVASPRGGDATYGCTRTNPRKHRDVQTRPSLRESVDTRERGVDTALHFFSTARAPVDRITKVRVV